MKYGLKVKATGELVRVETADNHTYRLTDAPYCKIWTCDSPEAIAKTLFPDAKWYNSDHDCPCWGQFTADDLTPVTIETVVTPVEIDIPYRVEAVQVRDIHARTASQYANKKLDIDKSYCFVLANETISGMQGRVNNFVVLGSVYQKRKLVAVSNVPEEYVEVCEKDRHSNQAKGFCLLICE